MKRRILTMLFTALLAVMALPLAAQERDKMLNITVTDDTGESLAGQAVSVEQTDYQLAYPGVTLNADGKVSLMVYAGGHTVTVERSGYNTAKASFVIADGETSKDVELRLTEKTRQPFALSTKLNVDPYTAANTLTLTWNTEKPAFFDDFESYDAFAINFGEWTGIDGDRLNAAQLSGDYPNRGLRQYAQIMNPLAVTPMWYYDYPVLRAYEGKQYVGFVRTGSGDANNDWLITPEITVGTDNVLSFMAKAADKYLEKFIVYVTTKTDNPEMGDFQQISAGNYETVDYKAWHKMQYDLSEYAGQKVKIAVRYIGDANSGGAFMLMMDDFYVGQAYYEGVSNAPRALMQGSAVRAGAAESKSPANPNELFDVYMDGEPVGTTAAYSYTFRNVAAGLHTVGVKARYKVAESELATAQVNVDAADYAHVVFNVAADSKASADGQGVNMLAMSTGENYSVSVAAGKAEIKALPVGQYIMSVQKGAFKEYSQTVDVNGDRTFDIALEDDVLTPYNITAELASAADGTKTAVVKWNQMLGFADSFESYADFATGEFGGWKSVDNDQMPVYTVALGEQSNIVSFPGSGTATNPAAIAPMVFNPWHTSPAMLPTDAAMYAPDGDKYVVFFSPQRGKADKWLISPLVDVYEGYELKATAKSYTDSYPETIEFAVSEGGDAPDDFTVVSTAEGMPGSRWTEYSTPLSQYAGKKVRVAIHYTSYDTFFAQVDNVKVEPADGGGTVVDYGNVVKYNVYLDGVLAGSTETPEFKLDGLAEGSHTIGVEAVYKNATSEMATYDIVVTAVDRVAVDAVPASAEVYTLSGLRLNAAPGSLPHGVYVVKSGSKVTKIRK